MARVRLRARHPVLVVAVALGGLLIAAPARSEAPATASIVASDFAFKSYDGSPANVTIAAGGAVGFSYSSGASTHNVVFTGAAPSQCQGTSGPASGSRGPVPLSPSGPGWSGNCRFDFAGSYPFHCGMHAGMTGTVTVTGTAEGTVPPPPPPTAVPPPPPPPPAVPRGAAASALRVSAIQRGTTIRGSIKVSRAGSRLLVRTLTRRSVLVGGRSTKQSEIGRRLQRSVAAKRVAFVVKLSSLARKALTRRGRLTISLRVTVTPKLGKFYTATRSITLRRPKR
jgi:plastocyanin